MLEVDVRILKPDSFSAISFGAVAAERSFRKSFRKQPASAKPSASFRAHSAKHVSETIRGIVSDFKSSRDNRPKKPWLLWLHEINPGGWDAAQDSKDWSCG